MRGALLVASLGAVALAGCGDRDAGPSVRRDFQIGAFQSIALGGSQKVIVTVGGAPSVRAEGPRKFVDRLEIRVEGNSLHIGERDRGGWHFGFGNHASPVTIHVTVPSLVAASIGGSGEMRIDRVEGRRFTAAVGGSGDLTVQQLRVAEAVFSVGGSGAIHATGAAQSAEMHLAGSGDIDVSRVETRRAVVSLAGSGDVMARASELAQVSLVGSGDVTVSGPARCSITKRGSGEVHCSRG